MIKIPDSVGVLPPKVLAAIAVIDSLELNSAEICDLATYMANLYAIEVDLPFKDFISFDIYTFEEVAHD